VAKIVALWDTGVSFSPLVVGVGAIPSSSPVVVERVAGAIFSPPLWDTGVSFSPLVVGVGAIPSPRPQVLNCKYYLV